MVQPPFLLPCLDFCCFQASILGAVAGAHFARAVAPAYGIPVRAAILWRLGSGARKFPSQIMRRRAFGGEKNWVDLFCRSRSLGSNGARSWCTPTTAPKSCCHGSMAVTSAFFLFFWFRFYRFLLILCFSRLRCRSFSFIWRVWGWRCVCSTLLCHLQLSAAVCDQDDMAVPIANVTCQCMITCRKYLLWQVRYFSMTFLRWFSFWWALSMCGVASFSLQIGLVLLRQVVTKCKYHSTHSTSWECHFSWQVQYLAKFRRAWNVMLWSLFFSLSASARLRGVPCCVGLPFTWQARYLVKLHARDEENSLTTLLNTVRFPTPLHTLHSTLHTLHSTLYTPHSTLPTLHPHSTL